MSPKCIYQRPSLRLFVSNQFVLLQKIQIYLPYGFYYLQKPAGKLYIEMLTNPKSPFGFSKIKLNKKFDESMPDLQAVTGSDFTSSIHWLGKNKDTFILLFEEANLNWRTIKVIERFTCEYYGKRNTAELHNAHYQMFNGKKAHLILSEHYQLEIIFCFISSVQFTWHVVENKRLFIILRRWIK